MKIKFSAKGNLCLLLLLALQINIRNGYAQDLAQSSRSLKGNFTGERNQDTNINLRDAILRIKMTYQIDILFDDATVSGLSVSSGATWSKSTNAEEALTRLLKDFQLSFKKIKKDTYIIVAANARQVRRQVPTQPIRRRPPGRPSRQRIMKN